jgi:hypothetical protein
VIYATEPGRGGLAMTVRAGGNDWDLARARFTAPPEVASGAPLVLEPGSGPRTFDLRCEATGGGALVKSITIEPDRYDFEVAVRLEPGPGLPKIDAYTIGWQTAAAHRATRQEDETLGDGGRRSATGPQASADFRRSNRSQGRHDSC